jgi:hypothetical protein
LVASDSDLDRLLSTAATGPEVAFCGLRST